MKASLRYTKQELRHLRYRLITQEGLTDAQATARIGEMLAWTNRQEEKTKKGGVLRKKKGKATRKKA